MSETITISRRAGGLDSSHFDARAMPSPRSGAAIRWPVCRTLELRDGGIRSGFFCAAIAGHLHALAGVDDDRSCGARVPRREA